MDRNRHSFERNRRNRRTRYNALARTDSNYLDSRDGPEIVCSNRDWLPGFSRVVADSLVS